MSSKLFEEITILLNYQFIRYELPERSNPCWAWAHDNARTKEVFREGRQDESAIELIGDGAEIADGVSTDFEGMEGSNEADFDMAKRVDPAKLGKLLGLATTAMISVDHNIPPP